MDIILSQMLAVLVPAIAEYLIWKVIDQLSGYDISVLFLAITIILICSIPLTIILFDKCNFNSQFYKNYLNYTNKYIVSNITGLVIGLFMIKNFGK